MFRPSTVDIIALKMDLSAQVKIELKLDDLLKKLFGTGYCIDTEVCDDSLHVSIYEGPWDNGGRLLSWLRYDLTILEPGLEEAAKGIYLDWLFS